MNDGRYDTNDDPAEHDCAAMEEECAGLKSRLEETLEDLARLREVERLRPYAIAALTGLCGGSTPKGYFNLDEIVSLPAQLAWGIAEAMVAEERRLLDVPTRGWPEIHNSLPHSVIELNDAGELKADGPIRVVIINGERVWPDAARKGE